MAKGNLFLGTAAKSVGDVVMYRREGSQVSRVRVRKIANPKTDAQCKQRAIMAPIPKFFSPLAIVLERSFEGLSKSKSYSKFLKVNADKARTNNWLLPKGTAFFPLPYQLSQGSLPQLNVEFGGSSSGLNIPYPDSMTGPETLGELSTIFVSRGYQNGDIVTIINIIGSAVSASANFHPVAIQFEIDTTSTVALTTALPSLEISLSAASLFFLPKVGTPVAGSIIVARWENDKWRRSTQDLVVKGDLMTAIADTAYKTAAVESYKGAAADGNPLVYLDGEELQ